MQPAPVDIPHHRQATDYTCGPATMKMVLDALWGLRVEEESLADRLGTDPHIGTRQRVLVRFVDELGLQAVVRHTDTELDEIRQMMASGHVVIVCYWLAAEDTDHYAVVQSIAPDHVTLQDPWAGPDTRIELTDFDLHWRSDPAIPARRDRWLLAIKAPARPVPMASPGLEVSVEPSPDRAMAVEPRPDPAAAGVQPARPPRPAPAQPKQTA